jgi:hypothetical protein
MGFVILFLLSFVAVCIVIIIFAFLPARREH